MSHLFSSGSDASVQPLARCGVKPARWTITAAFVVVMLHLAAGAAAELTLVQDGQSDYRIVVAADASESVTAAAELLRDTVKESTGADLPIHKLTADDRLNSESKVIVLGESAYTESQGLDLSGVAHDGFRLLTAGNNLFVLGRDDAGDPFSHSLFRSAGTYLGVGRLLDEHLGVRQYLPGELWHHVPKASAWTVPDLDAVHNPDFLRRKPSVSYIVGDPDRRRAAARVDEALRYARFNGAGGGLKGATQHAVAEVMKPYVKDGRYVGEREWLALVDGQAHRPELARPLRPLVPLPPLHLRPRRPPHHRRLRPGLFQEQPRLRRLRHRHDRRRSALRVCRLPRPRCPGFRLAHRPVPRLCRPRGPRGEEDPPRQARGHLHLRHLRQPAAARARAAGQPVLCPRPERHVLLFRA